MKKFIRGPQAYLAWAYRPSPKVSQPNSLKPSSAEEICEIKHHTFDVAAQVLTAWPIVHFQGVVFHHCFGNGISYYTTLWLWVTANILISSERSRSFSCNQLTDTWQSKVIQQSPWVHNYPTTSISHDNLLLQEYDQLLHCILANWVIHVCVVSMGTDLRRSSHALAEEGFHKCANHLEWQWLIKNTFKDLISVSTYWLESHFAEKSIWSSLSLTTKPRS